MHMCMCMCMCMFRWVRGQGTSSGQHSQGVRKGDGDAGAERGPISCTARVAFCSKQRRFAARRLFGNAPQVCTLCGGTMQGPPCRTDQQQV